MPTDCPQRDERMGWTGDAQIFSATANLNTYTPAFYRKYIHDMNLEQKGLSGSVPHVVPDIMGLLRSKETEKIEHEITTILLLRLGRRSRCDPLEPLQKFL